MSEQSQSDARAKRISNMERRVSKAQPSSAPAGMDGRLPPGQSLVKVGFPVLDLGTHPVIPLEEWTLKIEGLSSGTESLDWAGFGVISRVEFMHDIHCVTAWSVFDAVFQGVSTQELIRRYPLEAGITHVLVHSADGYSANLAIEDFLADGALLATHLNGQELSVSHGGPMRLVVPHLYFWKSPKWVVRLEFLREDKPGFWEQRGYHNRGNPWEEERYGPKQATLAIEADFPPDQPPAPETWWQKLVRKAKRAWEYV